LKILSRRDKSPRSARRAKKRNLGRGIYILPTLLTTGNFFCGFYSIIASLNGRFNLAAWAILIALVFDTLDGKLARMTNSSTRFGLEFDSLSDLVSFGMAPGLLIYLWVLQPFGRLGWMAAFLFVICAALRLARFNVQEPNASLTRFVGLPSPAAGVMISSIVVLFREVFLISKIDPLVLVGVVYLLAFLMVSGIPYRSFKDINLKERKPFRLLVGAVLFIYVSFSLPGPVYFILAFTYVMSGMVEWGIKLVRGEKPEPVKTPEELVQI
jgi:CDP-diacylglycerol--serine O-phosphatidyltransferase